MAIESLSKKDIKKIIIETNYPLFISHKIV